VGGGEKIRENGKKRKGFSEKIGRGAVSQKDINWGGGENRSFVIKGVQDKKVT